MAAKWEKLEGNVGVLTIEVDAKEVNNSIDAAFKKVVKTINVPGFRKGNQLGTLCSGFRYFLARALNRLLAVKVHGRSLDDGNFDFASAT